MKEKWKKHTFLKLKKVDCNHHSWQNGKVKKKKDFDVGKLILNACKKIQTNV